MMTLNEAARVLGIDPGTLRVQIHNGKLKARKVGPIWTVTVREIERYRRDNQRPPKCQTCNELMKVHPSGRGLWFCLNGHRVGVER